MNRVNLFNAFESQDDGVIHDQINLVSTVKLQPFKRNRQVDLALKR